MGHSEDTGACEKANCAETIQEDQIRVSFARRGATIAEEGRARTEGSRQQASQRDRGTKLQGKYDKYQFGRGPSPN